MANSVKIYKSSRSRVNPMARNLLAGIAALIRPKA